MCNHIDLKSYNFSEHLNSDIRIDSCNCLNYSLRLSSNETLIAKIIPLNNSTWVQCNETRFLHFFQYLVYSCTNVLNMNCYLLPLR